MSVRLGSRQRRTLAALVDNGHYPNAWSWPLSRSETLRILESLERLGLVERRPSGGLEYDAGQPIASVAADWHLTDDGRIEAGGDRSSCRRA